MQPNPYQTEAFQGSSIQPEPYQRYDSSPGLGIALAVVFSLVCVVAGYRYLWGLFTIK